MILPIGDVFSNRHGNMRGYATLEWLPRLGNLTVHCNKILVVFATSGAEDVRYFGDKILM
ncbi:MAG: hypothetical protein SVY53_00025 [Chloroflexota bacterium]|nr:hypothetical protein [Chloroflexota bacterium]